MRLLGFLALIAMAAAAAPAAALADTVKLKSGQVIRGKVQDRGAYVIVERDFRGSAGGAEAGPGGAAPAPVSWTATASIRIERQEIASIEIDGQAAGTPKDLDIVVFVNGDELPGRVEIRDGGREVVIVGAGARGEVTLDSRQVREILWSKRAESEQREGVASVGTTIDRLLADLRGADGAARRQARERLLQLGVYALPYLETHREPDEAVARIVGEVREVARLRTYMTPALAERVPALPLRLVDPSPATRTAALKEAIVANPTDCAPILLHLAKHDGSAEVRAFVLGQLSLMDRTAELLELIESRDGTLRLAAAIALGDNGVLVGVPLVIEALNHEELSIRKVAIEKLETWTGQFLGYFPDAAADKRAPAVAKWEAWWAQEGPALAERSLKSTLRRDEISERERTEGLAHWTRAELEWDRIAASGIEGEARRRELQRVRFMLEKSIQSFPHNPNARIAIGVLDYTELGDNEAARRELELVLHRYGEDAGDPSRLLAHFHLGRIAKLDKRYTEAEKHFRLALSIDGRNVDVLRALGGLAFERAIDEAGLDREGRRRAIEESVKHFSEGIAALDHYEMELRENAERAADAVALAQPFKRGTFLKSVDAVKLELRRTAADLRYLRGRSYAALHDGRRAYAEYAAALDLDPDNPLYKSAAAAFRPKE